MGYGFFRTVIVSRPASEMFAVRFLHSHNYALDTRLKRGRNAQYVTTKNEKYEMRNDDIEQNRLPIH